MHVIRMKLMNPSDIILNKTNNIIKDAKIFKNQKMPTILETEEDYDDKDSDSK